MMSETRLAEEKVKKAMIDAARLADELRMEQEAAQVTERDRKLYEAALKDMQAKVRRRGARAAGALPFHPKVLILLPPRSWTTPRPTRSRAARRP